MDYYIPATITHYFYIFLSYFIPSLILFPTFHRPDRDNRHLKVAGIISAVFILLIFMLPKNISNSVCTFGVYFFWYASFSFLLAGTKSFKLTLALCFYCLMLFIEILCGIVVTFITLFFPSSNIVNAYSLITNNYFSIFFMATFGIFWELVSIKPLKRFFLNYGYLMTPGGNRSPITSISSSTESGVKRAGFSTTQLPAASAGAIFQLAISSGKFHGIICPTTPSGSWK